MNSSREHRVVVNQSDDIVSSMMDSAPTDTRSHLIRIAYYIPLFHPRSLEKITRRCLTGPSKARAELCTFAFRIEAAIECTRSTLGGARHESGVSGDVDTY